MSFKPAVKEWEKIIPPERLIFNEEIICSYRKNTIGSQKNMLGVIKVKDQFEVSEVVQVAYRHGVPLHPISSGKNWGYGSSLPYTENVVLLDMGLMNKIIECHKNLNYVTIEPGVTQQQLYDYFQSNKLPFMVPTTGAGPYVSLLGNAMEKGFGITPYEDHFGALLSLKAILPDGRPYQSTLRDLGGYRSDQVFRWKIGPYLEGLFAQGAAGIVTQGTIALAERPEKISQFICFLPHERFEEAIQAIVRIKSLFGSSTGGINIMNKRRLLSMMVAHGQWNQVQSESEMHVRSLAKSYGLPDWAILGGVYATKETHSGIKKRIKKELKGISHKLIFLDRARLQLGSKLLSWLPKLNHQIQSAQKALDILEGKPSQIALPLAYLKSPQSLNNQEVLNPAQDGCGLIWYSPLVPTSPSLVRDFSQEVERVCLSYDVDPLITLTTLSERCFDSTIPLVYPYGNKAMGQKVRTCYKQLVEMGKEMGIFPYRLDVEVSREYFDQSPSSSLELAKKIKQAIDPKSIIDPGRYHVLKNS